MSLNDRLAVFFKAHPLEWIPMRTLADLAGLGGWRNRVTDLRLQYGMTIENRIRIDSHVGSGYYAAVLPKKISEYRYVPSAQTASDAPQGHNLNAPWSLR